MKTEQPILITSITASGNSGATISKNLLIGFTGVVLANGAKQFGVCNADTSINEQAPIMCIGIALVKTSAAISLGASVYSSAVGLAAPSGTIVEGYALDASSGTDELIRVLLV